MVASYHLQWSHPASPNLENVGNLRVELNYPQGGPPVMGWFISFTYKFGSFDDG